MRSFNKLFVIALPRCATVSMSDALGILGISTAHLGRIYGEETLEHNNPKRLIRMHEQIVKGDFELDILKQCDGLADYPVCCTEIFQRLDQAYPGSLFVNVRRDLDTHRWLQSVERQFVGLKMVKMGAAANGEDRQFMEVMLSFREMTFGQRAFDVEAYERAYHDYQRSIQRYFADDSSRLLEFKDVSELEEKGFEALCHFLDCQIPDAEFPRSNDHSKLPYQAFMQALEEGAIRSQTGIKAVSC